MIFTRVSSYVGTTSGSITVFTGLDEDVRGRDIIIVEQLKLSVSCMQD